MYRLGSLQFWRWTKSKVLKAVPAWQRPRHVVFSTMQYYYHHQRVISLILLEGVQPRASTFMCHYTFQPIYLSKQMLFLSTWSLSLFPFLLGFLDDTLRWTILYAMQVLHSIHKPIISLLILMLFSSCTWVWQSGKLTHNILPFVLTREWKPVSIYRCTCDKNRLQCFQPSFSSSPFLFSSSVVWKKSETNNTKCICLYVYVYERILRLSLRFRLQQNILFLKRLSPWVWIQSYLVSPSNVYLYRNFVTVTEPWWLNTRW